MIESSNEPDRLPNAPHPRETLADTAWEALSTRLPLPQIAPA